MSKRGALPKSVSEPWTSILAPSRSATLTVLSFNGLPWTAMAPWTPPSVSLRNTSLATLALSPKTGSVLSGGGGAGGTSVAGFVAAGAVVTAVAASAVGAIGTAGCSGMWASGAKRPVYRAVGPLKGPAEG